MRQRTKKATLELKKETLRRLETRSLSVDELGQIVGGYVYAPRYTQCCDGCR